jgi:hypothetical protein
MPSFSDSLVITVKLKAKEFLHSHHVVYSTKVAYFLIIYYHALFQDPILNSTSVAPTCEVRVSAMLLLPIVKN